MTQFYLISIRFLLLFFSLLADLVYSMVNAYNVQFDIMPNEIYQESAQEEAVQ